MNVRFYTTRTFYIILLSFVKALICVAGFRSVRQALGKASMNGALYARAGWKVMEMTDSEEPAVLFMGLLSPLPGAETGMKTLFGSVGCFLVQCETEKIAAASRTRAALFVLCINVKSLSPNSFDNGISYQ